MDGCSRFLFRDKVYSVNGEGNIISVWSLDQGDLSSNWYMTGDPIYTAISAYFKNQVDMPIGEYLEKMGF